VCGIAGLVTIRTRVLREKRDKRGYALLPSRRVSNGYLHGACHLGAARAAYAMQRYGQEGACTPACRRERCAYAEGGGSVLLQYLFPSTVFSIPQTILPVLWGELLN